MTKDIQEYRAAVEAAKVLLADQAKRIAVLTEALVDVGCLNHSGARCCKSCRCGETPNTEAHEKCVVCKALYDLSQGAQP